ncbi:MAG TPA: DNA polymerase IV, partial [Thermoanaerobaculia bacterium]|nr:DNA polymerase IV [Thermoanaerobaculia bacterium]
TRQLTPPQPPASGDDIARIAVELLGRFTFPPEARYRLAGVGVSHFMEEEESVESAETTLFSPEPLLPPSS